MPYVLRRTIDDRYIAPAASHSCYTTKLVNAQVYPTREAAARAQCENEYIQEISKQAEAFQ